MLNADVIAITVRICRAAVPGVAHVTRGLAWVLGISRHPIWELDL